MQERRDKIIITILDGGMGHELKTRGVSDGTFLAGILANEISSSNHDVVEQIHTDYLEAGCQVITTNSFVAVPQRMMEGGIAIDDAHSIRRASQFIVASVDRARAAINKHNKLAGERTNKIAGCVPPLTECYFANLVPSSVDRLMSDYGVILSTLLQCNVDILLAETLSTTREAQAIIRSLQNIMNQRIEKRDFPPLWMSFTIRDDEPTMLRSDEMLETACRSIIEEATNLNLPLEALGINCATPSAISKALPILTKLVEGTNIKVCAYGNCFKTTTSEWISSLSLGDTNTVSVSTTGEQQSNILDSCSEDYDDEGYLKPEIYAKFASEWAELGARIIGGCCGSRPIHMRNVASALKEYNRVAELQCHSNR